MAKHCKECGKQFTPRQYNGEFCCTECRRDFNNRRATRGAMLYDLMMIEASDPDMAERFELHGSAGQLIKKFQLEDLADGRPRTWKRAGAAKLDLERYLHTPSD